MVIIGQTTESQNRRAISYDGTDGETLAPLLEVCYTQAPVGPTISTSGVLSAFSTTPGAPSTAQTYTVSGSNLTADITITAPDGFELSLNDSDWDASLNLSQIGGLVEATTIYVRLYSATESSTPARGHLPGTWQLAARLPFHRPHGSRTMTVPGHPANRTQTLPNTRLRRATRPACLRIMPPARIRL